MKKFIIILCLALTAGSVRAQKYWDSSRPDHRFTFGLRAGANLSKVFDDEMEWRYHFGYQVGAVVDWNLIRSLSLETGLYYIQKGFKLELEYSPSYTQSYNYSPNYLEVPLLLSYHIKLSDSSQFHFNAGGYYSFGLKGSDETFFNKNTGYKTSDLGVSMGVSVTYTHFYAGANYERSLANISNSETKAYNSSIVVSLGYNF